MKVAVIGGGVSGLSAVKALVELKDARIEVTAFEKSKKLGGLWEGFTMEKGTNACYKALKTNVSKHMLAFSDFPFPKSVPQFVSHDDCTAYINAYVDEFLLRKHYKMETVVKHARKFTLPEKGHDNGCEKWEVHHCPVGSENISDHDVVEVFDHLIVASGRLTPYLPCVPAMEQFQGEVRHSHDYKVPEEFKGKRVIVLGIGSSGCDIAADLFGVAESVTLSGRNAFVLPKVHDGRPFDTYLSRAISHVPFALKNMILKKRVFPLGGQKNDFRMYKSRLSPGDSIIPLVRNGDVNVKARIKSFLKNSVILEDGSELAADTVIFATGYERKFPFLEFEMPKDNLLYKHVFPPESTSNNISFIGLNSIMGAAWPISEIQARWVAQVIVGNITLPRPAEMRTSIEEWRQFCKSNGISDLLYVPDKVLYTDEIASSFNAKPSIWRKFSTLPTLLFGPAASYQWRLNGPCSWPNAMSHLQSIDVSI